MHILIPATHAPLFTDGIICYLDPDDDEAYWRFWQEVWAERRTVIVIEHDIKPDEPTLLQLWHCPEPWCTQPYLYLNNALYHGLGCVKFDAQLMAAVPDLWERVAQYEDSTHPRRHWCRLDFWSWSVLTTARVKRHEHGRDVFTPWHKGPVHGCS